MTRKTIPDPWDKPVVEVERITESGEQRITETGEVRIVLLLDFAVAEWTKQGD